LIEGPVLVVGAVVVEAGRMLLVQRARPPDAGKWSIPGGRLEPNERLRDAVAREVAEETGVAVVVGELAGWSEGIGTAEGFNFVALDFHATATPPGQPAIAGDDAAAARWVPLADVANMELATGLLDFLRSVGSLA
jgi:acetyl-CoA carboxylase carboxyl transferase subunit beta